MMADEELRHILANAGAELLSRREASVHRALKEHLYRIAMPTTSNAEPEAFRSLFNRDVIRIPRNRSFKGSACPQMCSPARALVSSVEPQGHRDRFSSR